MIFILIIIAASSIDIIDDTVLSLFMYHQDGYTALHWAAERGHAETVKLLLGRGANANTADMVSNIRLHRQITTMCVNHRTAIISPFIADLCSI